MTQPTRIDLKRGKSASYEQPFDMMEACHERLDRMLALLAKLKAHLAGKGADEQARQAAKDVMRYFDMAAPQHHRDEELHVFPPLLAQGEAATVAAVHRLQREHGQMEAGWALARETLAAIAEGRIAALTAAQAKQLDEFASLYAGHIEAEEKVAYPAAKALLDEDAQREMGREMQQRRNG
jgi:hemerythrin-like domain-containing protein